MMKVSEFIGGKIYKTHVTYRYLFDRNAEFKRAPASHHAGNHNEQNNQVLLATKAEEPTVRFRPLFWRSKATM